MTGETLLLAIALMALFEGLAFILFPEQMKQAMRRLLLLSDGDLRQAGFAVAAF
ncbi:MAG: DUF2065 family protein, partial [Rubricella sp.]